MKKHNHSTLESKLKTYSAIAAGVIATGSIANAQIIYTDIDPDIMLSDSFVNLDLDNNNTPDFKLFHFGQSNSSASFFNLVGLKALNNNEILGDTILTSAYSNDFFSPAMLSLNDDISANEDDWAFDSYAMLYYKGVFGGSNFEIGNWKSSTDKYIGLRIDINGKWHYGWARLDITSNCTSFIIKDYAYETYPEKHIAAGMQTSSIDDDPTKLIRIFSGPKNLIINTNGVELDGNQVSIYNAMGQKIKSLDINSEKNIISLDGFTNGVYVVNMTVEGKPLSRKFIVR